MGRDEQPRWARSASSATGSCRCSRRAKRDSSRSASTAADAGCSARQRERRAGGRSDDGLNDRSCDRHDHRPHDDWPDHGEPSTTPATSPGTDGVETLILDPTLPDPTPRLPVWVYSTAEIVGWDKDNWPAVKRGGSWALHEEGWQPMKRADKLFTTAGGNPPGRRRWRRRPGDRWWGRWLSLGPDNGSHDWRIDHPDELACDHDHHDRAVGQPGLPVARSPDGTRYFDGRTKLHIITGNGEHVVWPLPPAATGTAEKVHLVRMPDGLLFLYNQPGRILRIRPTPDEPEPFFLEATFTRNIPNADNVTRFWLDPAERLIMAHGNKLAIMFPRGYIPPAIASKIPRGSEMEHA